MLPGISTACFYPDTTEASLREVARIAPPCAEVFLNAAQELELPYLRQLAACARDSGIRITSVHPYLSIMDGMYFFSQYDRRFEEGMETYRRFYQAAAVLGADTVVFHGNYRRSPLPWEEYFRRFRLLWEDAAANGISLCQENVERCSSATPAFFRAMSEALPQVHYILDVKQAVRAGEEVLEMAAAMAGRIRHIHISDHDGPLECMVPGKGVFNIAEFLLEVRKTGFDGSVIVELYRENFADTVELSQGFAHLSSILSTLS